MDNGPFFTILVPVLNQAEYLADALDSLINQTYSNWEAIVVDNALSNRASEVIKNYEESDERVLFLRKGNAGMAAALNEAIHDARGEWICWLSSDNLFEPDKLEVHLQAVKENPGTHFFHSGFYHLHNKTGVKTRPDLLVPVPETGFQVSRFFVGQYIQSDSVVIHRSVFNGIDKFNETYSHGYDFDMWLRISARHKSAFINQKTCAVRVQDEQGTDNKLNVNVYDYCRACAEFLNSHEFNKCFPFTSLDTLSDAAKAIRESLTIAIKTNSLMYKCNFNTSLLERLAEWLHFYCSDEHKRILLLRLEDIINRTMRLELPEEIKTSLKKIVENAPGDFNFYPHDFIKESEEYARNLFSTDKIQDAGDLARYLSLIDSSKDKSCIRSNLKYWQKLQDDGYFENHSDYLGMKEFGDDYNIINRYVPLSKEMNVVVIGCGYGREVLLIAPHVKHVYGIDVNRTILDKADRFLSERGIHNFTSVLAAEWKDVIPGGIDLVYEIIVFQHLTRNLVKDYIHGLAKKLSHNGKILCQFAELNGGTSDAVLKAYEPCVRWSKTDIQRLFGECGLVENSIDTQDAFGEGDWHWAFFGKQKAEVAGCCH